MQSSIDRYREINPDYTHKDLAYDSEMCGYTQEQVLEMRQIKE